MKHNLEGIERAIEMSDWHRNGDFTCCLLSENASNSRDLYTKMFDINGDLGSTFPNMLENAFGGWFTGEEVKEFRLLALSFLYEICRLKNNKKNSGF